MSERSRAWRIRPRRHAFESLRACLVGIYWAWIRGYETEVCMRCGDLVSRGAGSWWSAEDDDWLSVMGHDGGVLCMRCFVKAWEKINPGRLIYWRATPWVESKP